MLLGAPGLEQRVSLLGARVLLGAPGLTTRTKGIATRSKDATGGSWPYY